MSLPSVPPTPPLPEPGSPPGVWLDLTAEEVALLRATVAFHAQHISDPDLRTRLEGAAAKLARLATAVARPQAA